MPRLSNRSSHPALPWALIWFGFVGLGVWVPLFLAQPTSVSILAKKAGSRATNPTLSRMDRLKGFVTDPLPVLNGTGIIDPTIPVIQDFAIQPSAKAGKPRFRLVAIPSSESILPSGLVVPADLPTAQMGSAGRSTLPGSLLLGGPLTLASLQEKPMVAAARIEQAIRLSSADPLLALPPHWRPDMQLLLQGVNQVLPAEVVRIPAAHRQLVEEIPLALNSHGPAQTTVAPSSPRSEALVEGWARRQDRVLPGQARPVLLVLEPISVPNASASAPAGHLKTDILNRIPEPASSTTANESDAVVVPASSESL